MLRDASRRIGRSLHPAEGIYVGLTTAALAAKAYSRGRQPMVREAENDPEPRTRRQHTFGDLNSFEAEHPDDRCRRIRGCDSLFASGSMG